MIIVISPAKSLDYTTPAPIEDYSQPDYLQHAAVLIDELRALSPAQIASLMGISDKLAVLNATRFSDWAPPFTPANAKQAVLAFNGDVYDGLDAPHLTREELLYAQQHLRILSGLYGLLRPLDLMQAYRLEMGTRFANARGKDLYAFWGDLQTLALNEELRSSGAKALLNLASEEYFKAVRPKKLTHPVISPVFEDGKAGKFKVISFYAKRARGLMARYVIQKRLEDPQQLLDFAEEGYRYVAAASTPERPVFRR